MMAVQEMIRQDVSLTKALRWCGVTRKRRYYEPKPRKTATDPDMLQMIQDIREERPFYGTRRMTGDLTRRLGRPANRKLVRRIYKRIGQNQSESLKAQRHAGNPSRQAAPTRYGRRTTHYVWCRPVDGWCYCNVLDIFTRQWIAYRFGTLATADVAIESIVGAVSAAKPDCPALTLQCDNGSQYAGKRFRKAASPLGINLTFIRTHMPGQNGHIESFQGSLKREYIWPHDYTNYQEAEAVIAAAIGDYNQARLYSALKYVPPDEFAASWEAEHK